MSGRNPLGGFDFSSPRMGKHFKYTATTRGRSFDVGGALSAATQSVRDVKSTNQAKVAAGQEVSKVASALEKVGIAIDKLDLTNIPKSIASLKEARGKFASGSKEAKILDGQIKKLEAAEAKSSGKTKLIESDSEHLRKGTDTLGADANKAARSAGSKSQSQSSGLERTLGAVASSDPSAGFWGNLTFTKGFAALGKGVGESTGKSVSPFGIKEIFNPSSRSVVTPGQFLPIFSRILAATVFYSQLGALMFTPVMAGFAASGKDIGSFLEQMLGAMSGYYKLSTASAYATAQGYAASKFEEKEAEKNGKKEKEITIEGGQQVLGHWIATKTDEEGNIRMFVKGEDGKWEEVTDGNRANFGQNKALLAVISDVTSANRTIAKFGSEDELFKFKESVVGSFWTKDLDEAAKKTLASLESDRAKVKSGSEEAKNLDSQIELYKNALGSSAGQIVQGQMIVAARYEVLSAMNKDHDMSDGAAIVKQRLVGTLSDALKDKAVLGPIVLSVRSLERDVSRDPKADESVKQFFADNKKAFEDLSSGKLSADETAKLIINLSGSLSKASPEVREKFDVAVNRLVKESMPQIETLRINLQAESASNRAIAAFLDPRNGDNAKLLDFGNLQPHEQGARITAIAAMAEEPKSQYYTHGSLSNEDMRVLSQQINAIEDKTRIFQNAGQVAAALEVYQKRVEVQIETSQKNIAKTEKKIGQNQEKMGENATVISNVRSIDSDKNTLAVSKIEDEVKGLKDNREEVLSAFRAKNDELKAELESSPKGSAKAEDLKVEISHLLAQSAELKKTVDARTADLEAAKSIASSQADLSQRQETLADMKQQLSELTARKEESSAPAQIRSLETKIAVLQKDIDKREGKLEEAKTEFALSSGIAKENDELGKRVQRDELAVKLDRLKLGEIDEKRVDALNQEISKLDEQIKDKQELRLALLAGGGVAAKKVEEYIEQIPRQKEDLAQEVKVKSDELKAVTAEIAQEKLHPAENLDSLAVLNAKAEGLRADISSLTVRSTVLDQDATTLAKIIQSEGNEAQISALKKDFLLASGSGLSAEIASLERKRDDQQDKLKVESSGAGAETEFFQARLAELDRQRQEINGSLKEVKQRLVESVNEGELAPLSTSFVGKLNVLIADINARIESNQAKLDELNSAGKGSSQEAVRLNAELIQDMDRFVNADAVKGQVDLVSSKTLEKSERIPATIAMEYSLAILKQSLLTDSSSVKDQNFAVEIDKHQKGAQEAIVQYQDFKDQQLQVKAKIQETNGYLAEKNSFTNIAQTAVQSLAALNTYTAYDATLAVSDQIGKDSNVTQQENQQYVLSAHLLKNDVELRTSELLANAAMGSINAGCIYTPELKVDARAEEALKILRIDAGNAILASEMEAPKPGASPVVQQLKENPAAMRTYEAGVSTAISAAQTAFQKISQAIQYGDDLSKNRAISDPERNQQLYFEALSKLAKFDAEFYNSLDKVTSVWDASKGLDSNPDRDRYFQTVQNILNRDARLLAYNGDLLAAAAVSGDSREVASIDRATKAMDAAHDSVYLNLRSAGVDADTLIDTARKSRGEILSEMAGQVSSDFKIVQKF
ncbi:MAG: hypothetical protein WCT31_04190, partial [Candidatus Micrarchaeia archaeon]